MEENCFGAAVSAYIRATTTLDEEAWLGLFSPEVLSYCSGAGEPGVGREPLRLLLRGTLAAFDSLDLRDEGVLLSGAVAAIRWAADAVTHNGRQVGFGALDVVEFGEGGKIVRRWLHW